MCNLRPYQVRAVEWLCEHDRGILVLAAGGGKTLTLSGALDRCMGYEPEHNPTIGWIANTREQVDQAWTALRAFNIPERAHVEVACAAAGKDWSHCDVLVVDEVQHGSAPEWAKQIQSCKGVRWGMSATPWGRDSKRNAELKAMFGGNVFVIDREEVGVNLSPARVVWLDACDEGLPKLIDEQTDLALKKRMRFSRYQRMSPQQARGEVMWGMCAEWGIARHSARNVAAIAAIRTIPDSTLILCGLVEHVKYMAGAVGGVACYSAMGAKARREAIQGFKEGRIKRLVASTLADEGFDCPCAEVLVLLSGGRNEARTIQRTGRVLRPHPGKTEAVIYDFKDSQIPLMANHAAKRAQIYEKLGYSGDFSWT